MKRDPALQAALNRVAKRQNDLEKRVNGLGKSRLRNSSLEGGSIPIYDDDGNLMANVGAQFDGANGILTMNGPPPPQPGVPTLTAVPTGVMVVFDGTWANSLDVAPTDFSHFEVHASTDQNLTGLLFATLRGTIHSARGGRVLIQSTPAEPLYVRIVARNITGKFTVGDVVGPLAGGLIPNDSIDIDWETLGGSTIFYGATEPTTDQIGDLWYQPLTVPTVPPTETYQVKRWDGTAWSLVADQGIGDAILLAEAADAAASERAQLFAQDTAPTGLDVDDHAIWVDTNDGNRSYTWNGSTWVSRRLGNGAIEPNSLVASDVIATGTVTAALFEAVLVLASTIVAGSPTAAHVEIDSRGVILFAVGPEGIPVQSGALGTGDDGLTFTDPLTGSTRTSLTRDGLAVQSADIAGMDSDGDGIIDSGFRVYGQEFLSYLDALPRGPVALGFQGGGTDGVVANGISGIEAIGELAFQAKAGRLYKISIDGLQYASSAGRIRMLLSVRHTSDGTTPTTTNGTPILSHFINLPVTNEAIGPPPFNFYRNWSEDTEVRLLLVCGRQNGDTSGSTISARAYLTSDPYYSPLRWLVEDVGPVLTDSFQFNNGLGSSVQTPGGTAPVSSKKNYTTTWLASWEASFDSGGKRGDTDLYQGTYGAYSGARGLAGFSAGATYSSASSEIGKTIIQAIGSATVTKIEYKLHCNHSYSYSGGTAKVGYHGLSSEPGSVPSAAYEQRNMFFQRGQTRWIEIGSANYAEWKNGTHRGITVGPTGDYMRFDGVGIDRPAVRISYTR